MLLLLLLFLADGLLLHLVHFLGHTSLPVHPHSHVRTLVHALLLGGAATPGFDPLQRRLPIQREAVEAARLSFSHADGRLLVKVLGLKGEQREHLLVHAQRQIPPVEQPGLTAAAADEQEKATAEEQMLDESAAAGDVFAAAISMISRSGKKMRGEGHHF